MIWNTAWPAYGPNGGKDGVSCAPRTSVPTSAVSAPDDCATPLSVTSAVITIVFEYAVGLNTNGGGDGGGGDNATDPGAGGEKAAPTGTGGDDDAGGGGDGTGGDGEGEGSGCDAAGGGGDGGCEVADAGPDGTGGGWHLPSHTSHCWLHCKAPHSWLVLN